MPGGTKYISPTIHFGSRPVWKFESAVVTNSSVRLIYPFHFLISNTASLLFTGAILSDFQRVWDSQYWEKTTERMPILLSVFPVLLLANTTKPTKNKNASKKWGHHCSRNRCESCDRCARFRFFPGMFIILASRLQSFYTFIRADRHRFQRRAPRIRLSGEYPVFRLIPKLIMTQTFWVASKC